MMGSVIKQFPIQRAGKCVKETSAVVSTLVPEQYKPTAIEAKSHKIMG